MKQVAQKLETSTLIKELLNLELETLETLCPSKSVGHDRALAGLGELMRRIMQLTLTLRDKKDLTLYLHSPESARAWGFPDVVSANFAALLIWSNVRPHRYRQGANYAPLLPPQLDAVDAPPPADVRFVGMSMHDLIAAFCQSTPISPAADFASDDDTATTSPFLRAAARSILRFDPMVFAAGYYDTEEEIANALANESGAFVGFALLQFGFNVMHTYHVMRHRKTVKIILRTEADAGEAELPSAQIANLTTILAASLHCDDTHRVAFYPPEERSKKEVRELRDAACILYRRYSYKRHEKFDQLVEGARHFGTTRKFRISDRLLHAVARECDPKLENMPVFVRGIELGLGRNSNQLPAYKTFLIATTA